MTQLAMYSEEQKMLDRFLRLAPARFSSALGENAYEFLLLIRIGFTVYALLRLVV